MVTAPDDAELMRRFACERDEAAFADLIRRYLGLVYHAALRQVGGDSHLAEDVAQEVFTRLARKAKALTTHSSLAGWLHTAVRYVAGETMRAERRRRARELEAYVMSELTDRGGDAPEWEKLRPVIDEAVAQLGERDRDVVLLRFFAGLPLAEIGRRLNVTENAARMRVERALSRLQIVLTRRGVTSASSVFGLGGLLSRHAAGTVPPGMAGNVTSAALANAAAMAGAAGSGGVIAFMSTAKAIWTTAGAILLLTASGVLTVETRARLALETEATRAEVDLGEKRSGLERLKRQLASLEEDVARAKRQTTESGAPPAGSAADAAARTAAAWDPIAEGRDLMEKNPSLKQSVIALADATNRFRFAGHLKEWGMNDTQIESFIRTMREFSVQAAPVGLNGMSYAFPAGEGLSPADTQQRLREIMGEANYRQLGELHRLEEANRAATSLAGKLALTDAPVTTEQTDRLQKILLGNRKVGAKMGQPSFEWDAVMAQASTVFSLRQLEALARVRAEAEASAATQRPAPVMPLKNGRKS